VRLSLRLIINISTQES
jgi:hypothetical protein